MVVGACPAFRLGTVSNDTCWDCKECKDRPGKPNGGGNP